MGRLVFFFDESHKHDKLRVKNGKLNFQAEGSLQSFASVSVGCLEEDLPRAEALFLDFESKWKKQLGFNEGELKSNKLDSSDFKYGFSSCKRRLGFYSELLDCIIEINPLIQMTVVNEMEVLLRKMIQIDLPQEELDAFYYTLSKLFTLYGDEGFFETSVTDPILAVNKLIVRLYSIIEKSFGVRRLEQQNSVFARIAFWLETQELQINVRESYSFAYLIVPDGFFMLLEELNIPRSLAKIVIDGEEGTYSEVKQMFDEVEYANSSITPMIRVADHLAGIMAKLMRAMNNDPCKQETTENNSDKIKLNERRLLDSKWFDLTKMQFFAYLKLHKILIETQKHYWTTLSLQYADSFTYFVSFLSYFHEFDDYELYRAKTPECHSDEFEQYACVRLFSQREVDRGHSEQRSYRFNLPKI